MTTFKTSRTFQAPPAAVFAALAAPQRLARWWGPDGFRNSFEHFDLRPGGHWRFTMHGPDGTDYPNEARFDTVEPDRAVVIRHVCAPLFTLSITLDATPQGTRVGWVQVFDDPAVAEAVRHIVEPANEQNLSRWQAEVAAVPGSAASTG